MLRVKHCPLMPQNDAPGLQLSLYLLLWLQLLSFNSFPIKCSLCLQIFVFLEGKSITTGHCLAALVGLYVLLPPLLLIGWAQMAEQAALAYHVGSTMALWCNGKSLRKQKSALLGHMGHQLTTFPRNLNKFSLPGHFDSHHFSRKRHRACNASHRIELGSKSGYIWI